MLKRERAFSSSASIRQTFICENCIVCGYVSIFGHCVFWVTDFSLAGLYPLHTLRKSSPFAIARASLSFER
jgi:hypothetical protein